MAIGSVTNFIKISGRIAHTPTDFLAAFPHGGTAMGEIREGGLAFNPEFEALTAEEYGGTTVDFVQRGPSASFGAVLREFDADALAAIFPNIATGAASGRPIVRGRVFDTTTGSTPVQPGALASDRAVSLVVSPRATDEHPAIYIPNAIPLLDEAATMQINIGIEVGFAVLFHAIPNSDGRLYDIGLLEDLTV